MADYEEEEVEEFGRYAPTRFCRTDKIDVTTPGTYFPNYAIDYDDAHKPTLGRKRPADNRRRDDSFEGVITTLTPNILSKCGAVGILYVVKDTPGRIADSAFSAGTWSLFSVNSKLIGITALHTSHNGADDSVRSRFFIDVSDDRYKDKLSDVGDRDLDLFAIDPKFVEVFINVRALEARKAYINSLSDKDTKYAENLDPQSGLRSEPLLDVMMFEVPVAVHTWPHFTLATAPPASNSLALLIAYHSSVGGRQGADREYKATVGRPPTPGEAIWKHRSLGVGKVAAVGTGIINIINSTAFLSSGGALLNPAMEVFAFNVGGFYDDPVVKLKKHDKRPLVPWEKDNEHSLTRFDMGIPENNPESLVSRNFTVALSVFHPGFKLMLSAAIAP